jgi:LuxR family maltose regulon positive regulatory protein
MSTTFARRAAIAPVPAHPAIAAAVHGIGRPHSPKVRSGDPSGSRLTRREAEILRFASEGLSNRQIGQLLWITSETVKFHLHNVYAKLGVTSRFDAARWAYEHGVLDTADEAAERTLAS